MCFNDLSIQKNGILSTFVDILAYRAKNQCEQIAYKFLHRGETESEKLTYKDLDFKAREIATYLQSLNADGKRALLLYSPGLEFVIAFFGCLYAGVVAVPAYPPRPNQKILRLKAIIEDAQAEFVLTTSQILSELENRSLDNSDLKSLHWLATDNIDSQQGKLWRPPEVSHQTLAFLQYTSGSTGKPKGVMISHGNLLHNERMIAKAFGHTEKTVVVGWLPLFHDMGLIGNILQPIYLGRPCILMSPIDFLQQPFRWLLAISRYKATTSGGPNFAYDLCIRKITPEQEANLDLSSWEVAFTGAEPVRAETLEQFANKFKPCGFRPEAFYPCYGMAETTLFATGGFKNNNPRIKEIISRELEQNRVTVATGQEDKVAKIVSCGKSWLKQKVIIADPESLTQLPSGRVGEIWLSGDSVAQGYWNRPLETEKIFNAHLENTGEGPFLRTGDLGFIHDGELFVTGRLKDVIIIRGQNYYPQDIEFTVENSHPALRASCGAAFAVKVKGLERLVVVQEIERSYLKKLDSKEVYENIRRCVTAEHSLRTYAIVLLKTGSIPKTSSGKVKRFACKASFQDGSLNVVSDWSESPLGKANFRHLQAEPASVFQTVQVNKN